MKRSGSSSHHPPRAAGDPLGTTDRASGCLSGRALYPLRPTDRCGREHQPDESCDQEAGVDPKKRTMGATERDEARRRTWIRLIRNIDARRLVFIDESGANITLARRYGRAPS